MRRVLAVSLFIVLGLTALRANWGGGDSAGSIASGAFAPFGTAQVEMQRENLTIDLYRDRAKVQVEYVLQNTGEAVDVKAAFPCLELDESPPEQHKKSYTEIQDYQILIDGRQIPYRVEKGDATNWKALFATVPRSDPTDDETCAACRLWWLASTVHFDKAEAKHVTIRYESLYQATSGSSSARSEYTDDLFRYLLSTARPWKGPIQQGKVTIKAVTVDPKPIGIKPKNRFKQTPEGFVWEFSNLKPTLADNIEVSLNNAFSTVSNENPDGTRNDPNGLIGSSWYSFEGARYYFDFHGYTATASSQKPGYPVTAIGDFARGTAWVAGKNGGIGESVTLTLIKPQHVDQIGIIPGYTKSKELYFANNRVREIEVTVNGGSPVTATLPDEYISFDPMTKKAYEWIDLRNDPGLAKTITLTVKKVYPGTKYNDTCVSEVLLRKRLQKAPEIRGAR